VLGTPSPRPKAPFEYTNSWGGNISVLGIWFLVGWWAHGSPRRRWVAALVVVVAVVPIVYSLNRGLWIGIGVSLGYALLRLVARGRIGAVVAVLAAGVLAVGVVALSPLHNVIQSRLEHGQSNTLRASLSQQVVDVTTHSPIVGYGSTRTAPGSPQSIAVGKTSTCAQCGNAPLGSTGQMWYDIIASGFVGAGLYLLFFLQYLWRYRRDRTAIGVAGQLVMILIAVYGLVYDAVPSLLPFYMLSVALLWRNDMAARAHRQAAALLSTRVPSTAVRSAGP
jgi:O-antigen ligase